MEIDEQNTSDDLESIETEIREKSEDLINTKVFDFIKEVQQDLHLYIDERQFDISQMIDSLDIPYAVSEYFDNTRNKSEPERKVENNLTEIIKMFESHSSR
jgi:hypothetical protein